MDKTKTYLVTVTWEGNLMGRDYGIGTYRVRAKNIEEAVLTAKLRMMKRRKRRVEITAVKEDR